MSKWFGDKQLFAMRVGQFHTEDTSLRRVEIWAANQHLTCEESWAHLPTFCCSLDRSIADLLSASDLSPPWPDLTPTELHRRLHQIDDGTRERFWSVLHWGHTTDNVEPLLFRLGDNLLLTFVFWRPTHPIPADINHVFSVQIPERELLQVLQNTNAFLRNSLR